MATPIPNVELIYEPEPDDDQDGEDSGPRGNFTNSFGLSVDELKQVVHIQSIEPLDKDIVTEVSIYLIWSDCSIYYFYTMFYATRDKSFISTHLALYFPVNGYKP